VISYLRGRVLRFDSDTVTVDVQGVGYEVFVSTSTLSQLLPSEAVELFIFTNVKEDALQLFGFISEQEKKLFLSLTSVNGIGPKLALSILSGASIDQILNWIESGDAKALTSLPKVGKKTAEQMILSLKGQLVFVERKAAVRAPVKSEVSSALINLGFRPSDVERVVEELGPDIDVEKGVRLGLQALTKENRR
jgi:Holliday junction DNA helicase RuvA